MKEEKPESSSVFGAIIPKSQVGSVIFMLILTGLLNRLFSYFIFLLLIEILLLRTL
jgi:hypothetical protein